MIKFSLSIVDERGVPEDVSQHDTFDDAFNAFIRWKSTKPLINSWTIIKETYEIVNAQTIFDYKEMIGKAKK